MIYDDDKLADEINEFGDSVIEKYPVDSLILAMSILIEQFFKIYEEQNYDDAMKCRETVSEFISGK